MSGKKEAKKSKGGVLSGLLSRVSRGGSSPRSAGAGAPPSPKPAPKVNLNVSPDTVKAITKFQAIVRGHLVRRGLRLQGSPILAENQYRAIKGLVRVETKYVANLELLINAYMQPCLQNAKGNKKKLKAVNRVFIDVEQMYEHHKQMLTLFTHYLELWPSCQGIGRAIARTISKFSFYEDYVNNIPKSKQALIELEKEKSSIVGIIEKINTQRKSDWNDPNHIYRDFRTLLKLPLKHLVEYKHPLKKLMINTPPRHPDYAYRISCSATFREIGLYIKYIYTEAEAKRDMELLDSRLATGKNSLVVLVPKRKIIRQGEMQVNGKPLRQVIVFNDVCVISEIHNRYYFTYMEHFDLKGASIQRLSTSADGTKQVFSLTAADGREFTFSQRSDRKSKSWQKSFEEALSKRNDRAFGVPLIELAERDGAPIPKLLFTVGYRLNRAMKQERIFRSAGESSTQRALKRRFNHHITDIDLSTSRASDIASLLVGFLELLPDPIMEINHHDEAVEVKKLPKDEFIFSYFSRSIEALHPVHRNTLEFIVFLLHRAAGSELEGFLTTIELAVLFAPLLFKPSKGRWTIGYCYRMPRIARLFERVISHPDKVFPGTAGPLPKNLDEFLFSDYFGPWWRRFRVEEKTMIDYLKQPQVLDLCISKLGIEADQGIENLYRNAHAAALSCIVLTNNAIIDVVVNSQEYLQKIFNMLVTHRDAGFALNFIRDTIEGLFEEQCELVTNFLTENMDIVRNLLHNIDSGTILSFFTMLSNLSFSAYVISAKYHRILSVLATETILLFSHSGPNEAHLSENLFSFLDVLLNDDRFLCSDFSRGFCASMNDHSLLRLVCQRALSMEFPESIRFWSLKLLLKLLTKRVVTYEPEEEEEPAEGGEGGDGEASEATDSEADSSDSSDSEKDEPKQGKPVQYPFAQIVGALVGFLSESLESAFANEVEAEIASAPNQLGVYRTSFFELVAKLAGTGQLHVQVNPNIVKLCMRLFEMFPTNNILHAAITDIVVSVVNYPDTGSSITAVKNSGLIPVLTRMILNSHVKECCYFGHLFLLASTLNNSVPFAGELRGSAGWSEVTNLVKIHQEQTIPADVKRRHRSVATDRYEDRI